MRSRLEQKARRPRLFIRICIYARSKERGASLHQAAFSERARAASPWSVPDLCAAYDWPTDEPGRGVIGIVELGGGGTQADAAKFFTDLELPVPNITDVSLMTEA